MTIDWRAAPEKTTLSQGYNAEGEITEVTVNGVRYVLPADAPQYPVELVERAFELCAEIAATNHPVWAVRAARITQEAQPVDPDYQLAMDVVFSEKTHRTERQIQAIRDGRAGQEKIAIALAAIKRVRAEKG